MATYKKLLKNRAGDNIIPVTNTIEDYSFSEVDTGHTWVDGKHIYKKTIDFGYLPNASEKHVETGITNLGTVIKIEGFVISPASFMMLPLVYRSGDAAFNTECSVRKSDASIGISNNQDRTECYAYVTLYYTKTS